MSFMAISLIFISFLFGAWSQPSKYKQQQSNREIPRVAYAFYLVLSLCAGGVAALIQLWGIEKIAAQDIFCLSSCTLAPLLTGRFLSKKADSMLIKDQYNETDQHRSDSVSS